MSTNDPVLAAQVNEALARTLLTEGKAAEAERLAREAAQVLESAGEQILLTRAITTHGVALARLNRVKQAHLTLQRALEAAHMVGDYEGAGETALTIIEELGDRLALHELGLIYERAADLLATSQRPAILLRLSAVARRVVYILLALPLSADEQHRSVSDAPWTDFSFYDEVHRYESLLIEHALKKSGGSVSRAARLLGFENHQTLIALLNGRHKNLQHARTPAIPRKRSGAYDSSSSTIPVAANEEAKEMQPITILYVEDNKLVLGAVKDSLELEGWHVEAREDGTAGLAAIEGDNHYDVLLLDNDLPGVNGLELIRHARLLEHRRQTPIVMMSASLIEAEARRAGANEFLRKPEDITIVADVIKRLLALSQR